MSDEGLELLEVKIERVLGVREGSAQAVVLEREGKRFFIFVGPFEGAAVRRELEGASSERPMTHDLLDFVLRGFDVTVAKVVISALMNDVFCATVTLTRGSGAATEELRLDARASDSLVIALKAGAPLYVTRRVFDAVEDASEHLGKLDELEKVGPTSPFEEFEAVGEGEAEAEGESGLEAEAEDLAEDDAPEDEATDGGADPEPDGGDDRDRPLGGR